jgi:hypothetical protein
MRTMTRRLGLAAWTEWLTYLNNDSIELYKWDLNEFCLLVKL